MTEVGDNLFAWQVKESDGQWSMVGAMIENMHSPLIHRKLDVARLMQPLAEAHAVQTGQPLRLVRFTLTEVIDP